MNIASASTSHRRLSASGLSSPEQQQQHHQHQQHRRSSAAADADAAAGGGVSSTGELTHRKNNTTSSRKSNNNNNNQDESSTRSRSTSNHHNNSSSSSHINHNDAGNNIVYSPYNNNNSKNTPTLLCRNAIDVYQTVRYKAGKIVNNSHVELFIVALIAINAIAMGIGTYPFVKDNAVTAYVFEMLDLCFLIIFTIELFLQFVFHGWRLIFNGWLFFDLVIIVTSWTFAEVQIIRAFRIFRALRLITRVKVMKNLVLALFGVMPRMFAIGLLLLLVSYIFAVMFTQLFKDLYSRGLTSVDYFGRIDDTFFTLFQIMTLDAWAEVCREVMAVYAWAWVPFIVFVVITGFVVVNLIIAVICEAIAALHDDEKAKLHGTYEDEHPEYYDEHGNYIGDDPDLVAAQQEHEREQHHHHQTSDDYDLPNARAETTRTLRAAASSSSSRFRSSKMKGDAAADSASSSSSHTSTMAEEQRSNVGAQLDQLELHVEDLTKMQEQTILTLQILTQELQAQRAARQRAAAAATAAVSALGAA